MRHDHCGPACEEKSPPYAHISLQVENEKIRERNAHLRGRIEQVLAIFGDGDFIHRYDDMRAQLSKAECWNKIYPELLEKENEKTEYFKKRMVKFELESLNRGFELSETRRKLAKAESKSVKAESESVTFQVSRDAHIQEAKDLKEFLDAALGDNQYYQDKIKDLEKERDILKGPGIEIAPSDVVDYLENECEVVLANIGFLKYFITDSSTLWDFNIKNDKRYVWQAAIDYLREAKHDRGDREE